jgi:hypothetical protein
LDVAGKFKWRTWPEFLTGNGDISWGIHQVWNTILTRYGPSLATYDAADNDVQKRLVISK